MGSFRTLFYKYLKPVIKKMDFRHLEYLQEKYLGPERYLDEAITSEKGKAKAAELNKEQVDIYDIILSHLLDEGYAETPEAAEAIMVSMSEDWRESIVDEFVELNEGVRSTLKKIFGKNKKTKEDQPESRGAYLRRKYNVGPEKSDTSAKRQILNRSRARAERDERDYGDSRYSKSVAQKSREAHNRYLKAGYSKYGATHTAGSAPKQGRGNKARRRTENR